MISCDRRRALLTTLILLARMICQTLCWPTLNCFYLSHFVLLFGSALLHPAGLCFWVRSCLFPPVLLCADGQCFSFSTVLHRSIYSKTVYCLLFSVISAQLKRALYMYFWGDAEAGQVKNAGHENPVPEAGKCMWERGQAYTFISPALHSHFCLPSFLWNWLWIIQEWSVSSSSLFIKNRPDESD